MKNVIAAYQNSEGEKLTLERRLKNGEGDTIVCLVVWDDPPPLGTGKPAPMLLDEGTRKFLLAELTKLEGGA